MVSRQSLILLSDSMVSLGGAETFARHFCTDLGADLCVGSLDRGIWPVSKLPGVQVHDLGARRRLLALRTYQRQARFRHRGGTIADYEVAVYAGSDCLEAAWFRPGRPNIHYCHAPPRWFYDQYVNFENQDLRELSLPRWCWPAVRQVRRRLLHPLRNRYENAVSAMDVTIANSENVRQRLRDYLGIEAIVIPPPCDTEAFRWLGQEDFYLSTARHIPLKRVDRLIEAFRQMPDRKLVVVSTGTETVSLRRQAAAASNITFLGSVDDSTLQALVGRCIATLYIPVDEDFGISPVESMAAGKPVVGVREGGLLETVIDGETGLLVGADADPRDIVTAVRDLDRKTALGMRGRCEARAAAFGRDRFRARMQAVLRDRFGVECR